MNNNIKSYSQEGQDLYVLNEFFKDKHDGFFVDIGANDGVTLSNSYIFEKRGWRGVCVEPIPSIFIKLKNARNCICIEGVVSEKNDNYVNFCCIDGYSEMLSGILDEYDERHKQRIINDKTSTRSLIKVRNYNFNSIINETKINYLSIDTEGNEFKILKSIDFKKYDIDIIGVENNYNDKNIGLFLKENGFYFLKTLGADQFFINKNF